MASGQTHRATLVRSVPSVPSVPSVRSVRSVPGVRSMRSMQSGTSRPAALAQGHKGQSLVVAAAVVRFPGHVWAFETDR
jgi:hypothetical protein